MHQIFIDNRGYVKSSSDFLIVKNRRMGVGMGRIVVALYKSIQNTMQSLYQIGLITIFI